ncbi:hypothetical protein RJ640_021393 [Escallonia rubra]|uniref:Phosphatidylinositol-glycan biosynthesis class F protein n=1 Tax=Escallonia rubra TaxID=112253 RepID=A0AA88UC50_9ASTE|nr:hypothetical protein RJ640_021393 [Escallonia rubra]
MERKKKNKLVKASTVTKSTLRTVSPLQAFVLHLICGLGLASAFWVARNVYSVNLIGNPAQTLRLIWVIEAPIVILLYSVFRQNPSQCSYVKAVARGFLALPFGQYSSCPLYTHLDRHLAWFLLSELVGAIANALGAIVLGAPVGIKYFPGTLNWSLLMSALTFVPAASVFGSSWTEWHRIFAQTKPIEYIDYMICLPAHGAVIGSWFGAWPMPLDWERPWQEWPVSVTYGSIAGYLVGMVASFGILLFHGVRQRVKGD